MFTARNALSSYTKQIFFLFKGSNKKVSDFDFWLNGFPARFTLGVVNLTNSGIPSRRVGKIAKSDY